MRTVIGSVLVAALLGLFTVAATELPPEIMADRYLVRVERLMEEKDYEAALDMMNKIVALQKEHGLTLPDEFHFKYAQVALLAGSIKAAMDSVNKYLSAAGKAGKFYREALELLDEAEQIQTTADKYQEEAERLISVKDYKAALDMMNKIVALQRKHNLTLPDEFRSRHTQVALIAQPCAGNPKGRRANCWMELANRPECYVNGGFFSNEPVTWTGECSGGLAQGKGTLTWVWDSRETYLAAVYSGKTYSFVTRNEDSKELFWSSRRTDQTGHFVDGKRHGQWVERTADGDVSEVPYVNGKRHGQWVKRTADGDVSEVPYVNGKAHGQWVKRTADGDVSEGPVVDGKRHGQWVFEDGTVRMEGSYVDGKRHGQWVEHWEWGDVDEGPYVNGKKHGQWVEFDKSAKKAWDVTFVRGTEVSRVERK